MRRDDILRGERGCRRAVTDDAEGIVIGQDLAPLKGGRGRLKFHRSGMVCSRVADAMWTTQSSGGAAVVPSPQVR